jgi:S-methylmethionine-dependent homocysteine/selenocysteine methylase
MRLTDGGLETTLIFDHGLGLPSFAAFPLLDSEGGRNALRAYWEPYLALLAEHPVPFSVDTPTWRANPDWGTSLGYDAAALHAVNTAGAGSARAMADGLDDAIVNGVLGPRGDGYVVGDVMTPDQAAAYHAPQIAALVDGGVDRVSLLTITYPQEAIGFARAAAVAGVPAVVSFTVETDGRLPNGDALRDAVEQVDAETDASAAGFMVNCAHPSHFEDALVDGDWLGRIVGIRANASSMSHAELDVAEELDRGDPDDLGARYARLAERLPALELLGGCCGTGVGHVRAIRAACFS